MLWRRSLPSLKTTAWMYFACWSALGLGECLPVQWLQR